MDHGHWILMGTINTMRHATMHERKQKNTTSVMPDHVRFVERVTKKGRAKENRVTPSATEQAAHGAKTRRYNEGKLESELIRQKWRLQQQQMEAHERRKKILIKEYEIQRERRLKQSTGEPLFKGPEGTQISSTELRKIKVDIYRNIPTKSAVNELQRDIVNPEDVVVKRRKGEGARPIFKREEITKAASNTEDVEERRIVATVKDANLENEPQPSKRRSASLSLTRNRSHSRQRSSPRHSRREDYKHDDRENRRSNRGRSRERKEDKRRTQSCHVRDEEKRLKERRSRDASRSRKRDQAKWNRDSHQSRSIGGRSGERRMPSQQISVIEQIPVPIYYGNFPPRPFIGPLAPIRGPVAFGASSYPMWPMRPFKPRFPPGIDMYRFRPPGNPRGFGPQY